MTRLPAENRDVVGIPYDDKHPKYKVGPVCSVPSCSHLADHSHHIWRRSFLAGDYGWVRMWNGTVVQNLTGLCWRHHDKVTINKASIELIGKFCWVDENGSFFLDPQPKAWDNCRDLTSSHVMEPEHLHEGPGSTEKCPTCSRALPREKKKSEEKRPRKSWSVSVPVDERENGAAVLDVLIEECSKIFGHDENKQVKYFTLAQALYLIVQNEGAPSGEK